MFKRLLAAGVFCFLLIAPAASSAHQPRVVDAQTEIFVEDPAVSKAYYGALEGAPAVYRIESAEPFPLYLGILSPQGEGARTDFTVRAMRVTEDGEELIATLLPGDADWTPWYEEYGADWYLLGPEYPDAFIARGELPRGATMAAGSYRVEVSNPGNAGAYALAVGEEEVFPPAEIVNALWLTPRLDRDFFGTVGLVSAFAVPVAALALYMLAWYAVSLWRKNMSVADIAWGLGFVLVVWIAAAQFGLRSFEQWAVVALVTAWGLRLGAHVARRNWRRPEDARYAAWRAQWGRWTAVRSFFQVFVLQGMLLLVVASSALMTVFTFADASLAWVRWIGVGVWIAGFLFESIGDAQLSVFLRDPKNRGRVMDRGLWRYTRHPNYFGEACMWWGIWLLGAGHPYWLPLIVSPIVITVLVRFVSGVPMLERLMDGKPGYAEYKKRTPVFVPWFPRQ